MRLKAAETKLQQKALELTTRASEVAAILHQRGAAGGIMLEALEDACLEMIYLSREYRRPKNLMEQKGQRG